MILLKQFKKVKENKDSTELMHPKGHKITVAHKGLSDKMKAQLKDVPHMNDGGSTPGLHDDYSDQSADVRRTKVQENISGHLSPVHQDTDSEYNQRKKDFGNSAPRLSMPAGMADGGEVNLDLSGNIPQIQTPKGMNTPMYQDPGVKSQAPYSDQFGYEPQANSQPQAEEAPSNVNIPQAPQAQQAPVKGSQPLADYSGLVSQMGQGIQQEANATGAQGKQEANAAQGQQQELQNINQGFQQKANELNSERMAVYNDLKNGHIEPQHFLNNMSGFGQAMTAIGVALGGYGAGINGGPNHAMDFLNKQIDKDIEAQKADMGKKENLLSHLNQQFGNLKDATIMAKAMQMDLYSTKMQEIADQSKNPIAQARAQQAIAKMHLDYQPQMTELAMRQSILGGMQSGQVSPARAVPWMVPPAQQAKALDEIQNSEVMNNGLKTVSDAMHQVQGLQSVSNRVMNPIQSRSQINAINLKISSLAKELFNKVSDQEIGMLESNHIGLTDSPQTAQVKLKTIQDVLNKHRSTPTLDAYGIKMPSYNTNVRPNPNAR